MTWRDDTDTDEARVFRFQKSYRVFTADQIDGLPEVYHPELCPLPDYALAEPIPYVLTFFDAIEIITVFWGEQVSRHAADVQKASDYLIARSVAGRAGFTDLAA